MLSIKQLLFISFLFFSLSIQAEERLNAKQLYSASAKAFYSADYKNSSKLFSEFVSRYSEEPLMQKAMPKIIYMLGCSWYNIKQMGNAVDSFKDYLKRAPEGKFRNDVLFRLANAYKFLNEPEKAILTYNRLLAEAPDFQGKDDVNFQKAVCFLVQEDYENAIPLLELLTKLTNKPAISDPANAYLIRCLYLTNRKDEALEKIKEVAKQSNLSPHLSIISAVATSLGDYFYDDFQYEKALDAYRCVYPKNDELMLRLGKCFYEIEMLWEAAVSFNEIKNEFPTNALTPDACVSLIYCYGKIGLYDRARDEIDEFIEKYPNHKKTHALAFLKAESFINQEKFKTAENEFNKLLKKYPDLKNKDRAEFYLHLSQAMQEKFAVANAGFEKWLKKYKKSSVTQNAAYWNCMTIFFNGEYSNSIVKLKKFLKKYPHSSYIPDVEYRIAVANYMLEKYRPSAIKLSHFVHSYSNHTLINEARVLRGDALAAMGELTRAVKAYNDAGTNSGPYYHYAVAQMGKCYKLMDDYSNMAEMYKSYIDNVPDSPNVIEGLYWLGWAYRQQGDLKNARNVYWDALTKFGNKRKWSGFENIIRDMNKMYSGSNGMAELETKLKKESSAAYSLGKLTLASRFDIALYNVLRWNKNTEGAKILLKKFESTYPDNILGADGLIFLARNAFNNGALNKAEQYFTQIEDSFSQNPLSSEAELRLAEIALKKGELDKARKLLSSAGEKADNMTIALEIVLEKAQLTLADKKPEQAIKQFEEILANRAARGPMWPEALFGIAKSYEQLKNYNKAIPYYQRIYVMYSAYTNLTAKAYFSSGQCFELLGDNQSALNSYNEMLADKRLTGLPEMELSKKRLKELL